MVVPTLTASEYAQRALDLLGEADADLAAGEYERISGTLWSAVEYAIAAVAVERGWECVEDMDLSSVVKRIEEECSADGLSGSFFGVRIFQNNMKYTFLDDYEFEFFSPSAHRFVSKVLGYLD